MESLSSPAPISFGAGFYIEMSGKEKGAPYSARLFSILIILLFSYSTIFQLYLHRRRLAL